VRINAVTIFMRVTIISRPYCTIQGMHFTAWRVGETYDVSSEIASLLIVEGCARLEMRSSPDRRRERRRDDSDRRQSSHW
jgi:hypothetical protein